MQVKSHYPPEERLCKPMTAAQKDLLRRIVKTNGGGVSVYDENQRVISGLVQRHMIQGKSGEAYVMVHTRAGLDWVRKDSAARAAMGETE